VPAILVSPFAKQGFIDDTDYDFTSVLRFIEYNWGVKPLATRDAEANWFRFGAEGPFDPALQREPEIIPLNRGEEPLQTDTGPPRVVFFGFYGLGMLLGVAAILIAFVFFRRRSLAVVQRLPGRRGSSS
jgi:phospholipase C